MSVILVSPPSCSEDVALRAALRASLGDPVAARDIEGALEAQRASRGAVLVLDLRRDGESGCGIVPGLRLALPSARMLCLLTPGHPPPADVDAALTEPFYLADVVRWCARAGEAPPGESVLADLATGLRHEIGNPLTALMLQLELLRSDGDLNGLSEQIDLIEDSGRRIQRVLEDVTHSAERRPVHPSPATLDDLLKAARGRLAQDEPTLAARLELSPTRGQQAPLDVDVELLAQGLADLWRYLLLAGEEGDRLTVETRNGPEDAVMARCRGRVPRLPADVAARLFTPLWARQALGLTDGLSLTAARGAFLRHRGDLRAHQEPSGLLRVDAILPRARNPSSAAPAADSDEPTATRTRMPMKRRRTR